MQVLESDAEGENLATVERGPNRRRFSQWVALECWQLAYGPSVCGAREESSKEIEMKPSRCGHK